MPRYTNTTDVVISIGRLRVEPKSFVDCIEYFPVLPTGLELTTAAPYYNPILLSQAVSSASTVTIPTTVIGNYQISIYADSGEVTVKFNSDSAVGVVIPQGTTYKTACMNRTINDVRFTLASGGKAYITVESI